MQLVFQDPYASLNPRMTIGDILTEPLMLHGLVPPAKRKARVAELLQMVGLAPFHARRRSEEHTSELQSLMRISYAVFCLKKKTKTHHILIQPPTEEINI